MIGNTTEGQGEVLAGFRGVWGHVCDAFWDIQDAEVVCYQLGYKRAVIATVGTAFRNFGGPKIWLENVQCLGRERKLKDCRLSTWGYLKRSCGRAGVVCDGKYEPAERSIEWYVYVTVYSVCIILYTYNYYYFMIYIHACIHTLPIIQIEQLYTIRLNYKYNYA